MLIKNLRAAMIIQHFFQGCINFLPLSISKQFKRVMIQFFYVVAPATIFQSSFCACPQQLQTILALFFFCNCLYEKLLIHILYITISLKFALAWAKMDCKVLGLRALRVTGAGELDCSEDILKIHNNLFLSKLQ